ncbi:MAG TPA: NADH-quinone oxidoreductase subunit C, partial [Gaiellaceae bacterium]
MSGYKQVPGLLEVNEALGETTLVVERERLAEAARHLRDELGFNYLADVAGADYLGWGGEVAGSWGSAEGRDLNVPYTLGPSLVAKPKPKRFSVSYHLLALRDDPVRVRLQTWLDDAEEVATVVEIWPTADWLEREVYDLMGVVFEGHPNLVRVLMP